MPCARISKSMISRPVAVEYADMVGSFAYTAPSRQSLPPKAARKLQLPSFLPARHARKSNLQGSGEIATRPVLAPICAKSKSGEREMVCHLTATKEVQWTATSGKGALANFNFKHDWCHLCHVQARKNKNNHQDHADHVYERSPTFTPDELAISDHVFRMANIRFIFAYPIGWIVDILKLSGQGAQDRITGGNVDMNKNNRKDDLDRMCEPYAWLWTDRIIQVVKYQGMARKIIEGKMRRRLKTKMEELVNMLGFSLQFSDTQTASQIGTGASKLYTRDRVARNIARPNGSHRNRVLPLTDIILSRQQGIRGRAPENNQGHFSNPVLCRESSGPSFKALGCIRPEPFSGVSRASASRPFSNCCKVITAFPGARANKSNNKTAWTALMTGIADIYFRRAYLWQLLLWTVDSAGNVADSMGSLDAAFYI
ncbi:hypothetical protein FIBSPDRAFT_1004783 [Athelia psychrophila]|uniref:Uncharacterized protein n=1 Tax=Athelia psychrophila TaxID=1759441 RepID=A0A166PN00_9AGAM|nr:hypothetical protein FIBSPDRAFT_1004783 [Fibularhizoctonia sp. CBS 109695]